MALAEINDVCFRYALGERKTLSHVNFKVQPGEFMVLCGPSGCGKTTLLRHFKKELEPVGERSGEVRYKGKLLSDYAPQALAEEIAFVMQDPDNQIVMDHVLPELVFSLENLGYSTDIMRQRVAEMAHYFGMEAWMHKAIEECSGGQKQIINLAAVLLLRPQVLLLDEPTAQLDPVAARELLQMVYRLNQEFAMTVIVSEHRLEEVFPLADKVIMLDQGLIKYVGAPRDVIRDVWKSGDDPYLAYLPSISKLYLGYGLGQRRAQTSEIPLTVKEGRIWLQSLLSAEPMDSDAMIDSDPIATANGDPSAVANGDQIATVISDLTATVTSNPTAALDRIRNAEADIMENMKPRTILLQCKDLHFQYDKEDPLILDHLFLQVYEGDFLAIVGGNGSGKSTLLQTMAGLISPQAGSVVFDGVRLRNMKDEVRYRKIGYLGQNPLHYYAYDTVEAELIHAAKRAGLIDPMESVERTLLLYRIESLRNQHPYDCSGGEQQKIALACVMLSTPQLLLLDEPTKGLDPHFKLQLANMLHAAHRQGVTVVIVTHDIEFAARYATCCAMLFDGRISASGSPADFFSENYFYTTALNRVVRQQWPQALTYEEVLRKWDER